MLLENRDDATESGKLLLFNAVHSPLTGGNVLTCKWKFSAFVHHCTSGNGGLCVCDHNVCDVNVVK